MTTLMLNPRKYDHKTSPELRIQLHKRDAKELEEARKAKEAQTQIARLGTTSLVALATGLLYQKKPGLENLAGTPVSLDHLLLLGSGAALLFLPAEEEYEEFMPLLEGLFGASAVPVLRSLGRKAGGFSLT